MVKTGRLTAVACATMASMLLTPAALSFDAAAAAGDARAKKACIAGAAVLASVKVSNSVDATDRQALRAVGKRLKKSSAVRAPKLARKVLRASRGHRKKFLAGALAVSRWCTAHHIGVTTHDGGTTPQQSSGASSARPVREYPGGGPVDVLYLTSTRAYDDLAHGMCGTLLADINPTWTKIVSNDQGVDTARVYTIAAYICVGRWQEAKQLYDQIPPDPVFSGEKTGELGAAETACARHAVLDWDRALLAEREQDPSFSPQFVTSSTPSHCEGATIPSSTSSSTSTSTSSSTSTTLTTTTSESP